MMGLRYEAIPEQGNEAAEWCGYQGHNWQYGATEPGVKKDFREVGI